LRLDTEDLFCAPEGARLPTLRELSDGGSLLDEVEPYEPPRLPLRKKQRAVLESPCRGPGRPARAAALAALACAGALVGACGDEDPSPIASDRVQVQLLPGRTPAWHLEGGARPVVALASMGPEEEPARLTVPVPSGRAPRDLCRELAQDAAVELCEPVALLKASKTPDDPRFKELWGLTAINAPAAWDKVTGKRSVVVAVVDDGVALTHPDLAPNLWVNPRETKNGKDDDGDGYIDDIHGYDFVDDKPDGAAVSAGDAPWHGSHVSGTIGAAGNNHTGVAGVNWQVSLMALRALGPQGGSSDVLAKAIDYAADHGARVINASWGGGGSSALLSRSIQRAGTKGALFVVAAGNDGASKPEYPANLTYGNVVSVSALGPDGKLASFSDRGGLLAAPGVGILSTTSPGKYERYDGTSMAAPHVSGAAALLFAAHPEAKLANVRDALVASASAVPGSVHGKIDVAKALAALGGGGGGGGSGGALVLSREALSFKSSGKAPRAQPLTVRDPDGAAGHVTIKTSAAWIVPSVTEGDLPLRLSVKLDPSRLSAGAHSGRLTLDAGDGRTATVSITLALTAAALEAESALVAGGPCSVQAGAVHAPAGAFCVLLPPGFDAASDDRGGRWLLPGGTSSGGARLHASFSQPGDYTLRYEDPEGAVADVLLTVE
jgi:subtilisin family serine protease